MVLIGSFSRYLLSRSRDRPSRFGWIIRDELAASGRLMTISQLAWVIKMGIKSVLTIRESSLEPVWLPKGCGITYKHLKVESYGAPPIHELSDAVDYIDNEIKDDKPVIVHCNGGSGRTGTILAAYLMKKKGLSAEKAAEKVKKIRGRAIRYRKQLETLKEYESYLHVKNPQD